MNTYSSDRLEKFLAFRYVWTDRTEWSPNKNVIYDNILGAFGFRVWPKDPSFHDWFRNMCINPVISCSWYGRRKCPWVRVWIRASIVGLPRERPSASPDQTYRCATISRIQVLQWTYFANIGHVEFDILTLDKPILSSDRSSKKHNSKRALK